MCQRGVFRIRHARINIVDQTESYRHGQTDRKGNIIDLSVPYDLCECVGRDQGEVRHADEHISGEKGREAVENCPGTRP